MSKTIPVYVNRYAVTIQSRLSKPLSASVIETSDVLTMVVSTVERNNASHSLRTTNISNVFSFHAMIHQILTQRSEYGAALR